MTPGSTSLFSDPFSDDSPLFYREGEGKALILLNRPRRCNAFSLSLLEELRRRLILLEGRSDLRVLLIAGAGGRFSSGLDLAEAASKGTVDVETASDPFPLTAALVGKISEMFPEGEKEGSRKVPLGFRMPWLVAEILLRLAAVSQAVIGVGRGSAFGGGGALLASCDIALAEPSVRFGFPECRRGIAPTLLHPFLEGRVAPRGLAPFLLTGGSFDAAEAFRLGLVDELAAEGEGAARAERLADEILAGAPERVREVKKLFRAPDRALTRRAADGLLRHWESWNEPAAAEGIAAFLEKRGPRW